MQDNVRPESMARITTPALAEAFIRRLRTVSQDAVILSRGREPRQLTQSPKIRPRPYLIVGDVSFWMTSWAPPSTIVVAETSCSTAFS